MELGAFNAFDAQIEAIASEALANAQNFSPFWYTAEAKQWLVENE